MHSINELSKRTGKIFDAIVDAQRALQGRLSHNGWGVLSDPSMCYSHLKEAREKLDQAIALLDLGNWPLSDAAWDRLEAAHNAEGQARD